MTWHKAEKSPEQCFEHLLSYAFFLYYQSCLKSESVSTEVTRLKVNLVLDREPNNYSNFTSFPILSHFAEIFQFFHAFVILISYSTESKNTICIKSIYFYLRRKIYSANKQFIYICIKNVL